MYSHDLPFEPLTSVDDFQHALHSAFGISSVGICVYGRLTEWSIPHGASPIELIVPRAFAVPDATAVRSTTQLTTGTSFIEVARQPNANLEFPFSTRVIQDSEPLRE